MPKLVRDQVVLEERERRLGHVGATLHVQAHCTRSRNTSSRAQTKRTTYRHYVPPGCILSATHASKTKLHKSNQTLFAIRLGHLLDRLQIDL